MFVWIFFLVGGGFLGLLLWLGLIKLVHRGQHWVGLSNLQRLRHHPSLRFVSNLDNLLKRTVSSWALNPFSNIFPPHSLFTTLRRRCWKCRWRQWAGVGTSNKSSSAAPESTSAAKRKSGKDKTAPTTLMKAEETWLLSEGAFSGGSGVHGECFSCLRGKDGIRFCLNTSATFCNVHLI